MNIGSLLLLVSVVFASSYTWVHYDDTTTAEVSLIEKADKRCRKEEAMRIAVESFRRAWDNYNTGNLAKMALSYQHGAQFTFSPDPSKCDQTVSIDLVQAFQAAYNAGDRGECILKAVEWDEMDRTVKIRSTDFHGPVGQNLTAVEAIVYFSSDYGCNYKAYQYVASSLACISKS